jgi:23S rRNA pseudouridine1911/1915/1917 synthase
MADQIESRIPDDLDGARLDKALATILNLSRAQAKELIGRGVTVDGEQGSARTRVAAGSRIVTPSPNFEETLQPEPVDFDILHEDDHVIVVDKPAGLVVHPGSGRRSGTLAAGLLHRYPEIEGVGAANRWGLVHRLDKDTSGALIVARTESAYEDLSRQIRQRKVGRSYLALVDGIPGSPTGTIDAPIGRDPDQPTRRAVVRGGKPARTNFSMREGFPTADCALLELSLETGRTHQIRVHLAAIDHPVIGDRTYGKKTAVEAPRTFLHAWAVEFAHPSDSRVVRVECPLPSDLQMVLDALDDRG